MKELTHGIWCVEDNTWCRTGDYETMLAEFPSWQSGEAAAVDSNAFHYEIRWFNLKHRTALEFVQAQRIKELEKQLEKYLSVVVA